MFLVSYKAIKTQKGFTYLFKYGKNKIYFNKKIFEFYGWDFDKKI